MGHKGHKGHKGLDTWPLVVSFGGNAPNELQMEDFPLPCFCLPFVCLFVCLLLARGKLPDDRVRHGVTVAAIQILDDKPLETRA